MKVNDFARKAYTAYTAFGLTPEGACGLMGNQFPESMGFLANRLEFLCVKRYKEKGLPADGVIRPDTWYKLFN